MRTMMPKTFRLLAFFPATAALMTFAVASDGATLKHKETGEIIKGTLAQQKINKRRGFRLQDGDIRFIQLDEWKPIEADKTDTKPSPAPVKPAGSPTKPAKAKVYILPIDGPIIHTCLLDALQKGLVEAKKFGATIVVFRLNTPGGRIHLGDKIVRMIEKIDWATTVAWVKGEDKRALSYGACICLAAHQIYMMDGATVGAATPYRITRTGSAKVDEKLQSAFAAHLRSLAEQRGHSPVIAHAMVDNSVSAVQAWLNDKMIVVTEEDAQRLQSEHRNSGNFRLGKTISKAGKLMTLTSREALQFKVCRGIADTKEDLMRKMGYEQFSVGSAEWITGRVEREVKQHKEQFEKCRNVFNLNLKRANLAKFPARSRAFLRNSAKALTEIERMAKDPRFDLNIPQEMINDMKISLDAVYQAL